MHEPSNDLERKLMLAADNPATRPEFYKELMASNVFVIGFSDSGDEGERVETIPAGAKLSIVNWEKNDGTPIIPFFTSLEALQRALKEESKYVALPDIPFGSRHHAVNENTFSTASLGLLLRSHSP